MSASKSGLEIQGESWLTTKRVIGGSERIPNSFHVPSTNTAACFATPIEIRFSTDGSPLASRRSLRNC